jgi:glycosyltransferase involved in cell wall biosynthesis
MSAFAGELQDTSGEQTGCEVARTRPLRVVLVAFACDPTRGTEPGMGWAWAEALAQRGHVVELLTSSDPDRNQRITRRIESLGPAGSRIRPHFVPFPPRPKWIHLVPGFLRSQTAEFMRYDGWQRDALHHARRHGLDHSDLVHHVSYGSLVGGSALRRLGPPLVFGPVGGGQTAPRSHRRYLGAAYRNEVLRELLWVRGLSLRSSCRATLRDAALVLTTNRDTASRARRLGRSDTHMMLCDGVYEGLVRRALKGEVEGPVRPPTVLWVGGFAPIKAPGLALQAFALLRAEVPTARLVMLGDGPLRSELEESVDRMGMAESVQFRGRLAWEQTLAAYDDADVLLFTSLRDSFGAQTLEAWARGLPVVHLDHQGVGDFSAPGGAVPVPLGKAEDLPQRLSQALFDLLTDQETRRRMQVAGLDWAKQHTWTAKAELAERLYATVLSNS